MQSNSSSLPTRALFTRINQFCRGQSECIDLVGFRHQAVSRALHRFAYQRLDLPSKLLFRFEDGSLATSSFPIGCLREGHKTRGQAATSIRAGLMSFRHGNEGLDYLVDFYVFRNQELSAGIDTQAEREVVAFEKATQVLQEIERLGIERVQVFHTGFMPAIMGFYRAVVNFLSDRRESDQASPSFSSMVFRGKKSRPDISLRVTPERALSNDANYEEFLRWS